MSRYNFHVFLLFKTHADTPLIEFKKPCTLWKNEKTYNFAQI